MTVGKDTIQTLLRQRQALRQALQELQKDIASLDAAASDLVAKNIKNPALKARGETSGEEAEPEQKEAMAAAMEPKTDPETVISEPAFDTVRDTDKGIDNNPGTSDDKVSSSSATSSSQPFPQRENTSADSSPVLTVFSPQLADVSDVAYYSLLEEARHLSGYYLRHPSPAENLPLQQLDDAISKAEGKADKQDRLSEYQNLRRSYRAIAGRSFSDIGINGKTLEDSRISAHILWVLPLIICALSLVIFPLLLLGRTLSLEMFTSDFAADLIWIFGVAAAFLWGAAGALTLLSVQVTILVMRRQYDADIRRSPGIRAALGGVLGCGIYALLEIWLPQSNITAEFFLNLGAFGSGLVAWIVFLSIQRGLGSLVRVFEPETMSSLAKEDREK